MKHLTIKPIDINHNMGGSCIIYTDIKDITNTFYLQFGFLYVASDYYVLAWNGYLEFEGLENIIFSKLPKILNIDLSTSDVFSNDEYIIEASIIITGEDDKLIEYRFGETECMDDYHYAMEKNRRISFARYDITHKKGKPLSSYSFSAENYKNPRCSNSFTELAVKLPIGHELTENLLTWALLKHKDYDRFKHYTINMNKSRDELLKFIYGNSYA